MNAPPPSYSEVLADSRGGGRRKHGVPGPTFTYEICNLPVSAPGGRPLQVTSNMTSIPRRERRNHHHSTRQTPGTPQMKTNTQSGNSGVLLAFSGLHGVRMLGAPIMQPHLSLFFHFPPPLKMIYVSMSEKCAYYCQSLSCFPLMLIPDMALGSWTFVLLQVIPSTTDRLFYNSYLSI